MTTTGFKDAELVALLPKLIANAYALTRNPDQANDLVQNTCEKMLRYKHTFITGNLFAWACTIMRNLLCSRYRVEWRLVQWPDNVEALPVQSNDDQQTAFESKQVMLRFAGSEISDEMWDALIGVSIDGLSYQEIGERSGVPVGTIKSRVCRARKLLDLYV